MIAAKVKWRERTIKILFTLIPAEGANDAKVASIRIDKTRFWLIKPYYNDDV